MEQSGAVTHKITRALLPNLFYDLEIQKWQVPITIQTSIK